MISQPACHVEVKQRQVSRHIFADGQIRRGGSLVTCSCPNEMFSTFAFPLPTFCVKTFDG